MTTRTGAHAEIVKILTDERYIVAPVPLEVPPATMAWLRANVARFSSGELHAHRRSLVVERLAAIDPARLRARSEACTRAMLDARPRPIAEIARAVPTIVLAEELGIVASAEIVEAVARAARAYLPQSRPDGMSPG
ncbi:MAG: hypothetical protein WAM30_04430, partial [Candidatus Dormiibacterota bacterium]